MIKTYNFKPFTKGSILGFFTLNFHSLNIPNCRLMKGTEANGPWIALPQQKYVDQDGAAQYKDLMYFSKANRAKILQQIFAGLQEQGVIEDAPRQTPAKQHIAPNGEDLSECYSDGDDDIPW